MSTGEKLTRLFSFSKRDLVAGAKKKSLTRFNDNLENLNFMVRSFSPAIKKIAATNLSPKVDASPQTLELLMIDEAKFGKFIAGEAHKFFLASMVSLERARQQQQHNLAWQIVEHYYAAYYSVHYLMRVSGYSLTNIDDKAVKTLKKSSVVNLNNMQSGLCTLEFSESCDEVTIIKNDKAGGSHKHAWSIWVKIIDSLIARCKTDAAEYSSLEIDLLAHKNFVMVNDHRFNPSDIRGEVNYQFKGDAWCFEEKTNLKIGRVINEIQSDIYSLSVGDDQVSNLINNNKFIINLAKMFFEFSRAEFKQGICRSIHNQF